MREKDNRRVVRRLFFSSAVGSVAYICSDASSALALQTSALATLRTNKNYRLFVTNYSHEEEQQYYQIAEGEKETYSEHQYGWDDWDSYWEKNDDTSWFPMTDAVLEEVVKSRHLIMDEGANDATPTSTEILLESLKLEPIDAVTSQDIDGQFLRMVSNEVEYGEDCVFDYEAAANSFGIATKEEEFVCDANDYWEELEDRNQIRKKFGMAPLTPEQFVLLQAQIVEMEMKGQEKLAVAKQIRREKEEAAAALLAANDRKNRNSNSVLKDFFRLFEDTCESNYDCKRPMICCDFGFKRQCCDAGKMAKSFYGEYAMIPIPRSID